MIRTPYQSKLMRKGRHLGGVAMGALGFCTSWAIDTKGGNDEWIEIVEIDMCIENLPEQFYGKRIVHVSDLHCSNTVSSRYLRGCIERVNMLDADVVVLTGDYITHDLCGRFRKKVVDLVEPIRSRNGVYACLGNHDYGIGSVFRLRRDKLLRQMVKTMERSGINVLVNESSALKIDGERLWFVGLGDLWADDFLPEKAFAGVPANDAVIALVHNPDSMQYLRKTPANVIMSGHTHGVDINTSISIKGTIKNRNFPAGMYHIEDKKLYVNRGLGRLGRAMFNTRPEITVFTLS